MSELNTLPFDFVQCSSTYITRIKEEEQKKIEKLANGESLSEEDSLLEGIKEGTLRKNLYYLYLHFSNLSLAQI